MSKLDKIYVSLIRERDKLESALIDIEQRIKKLEPKVISYLEDNDSNKLKLVKDMNQCKEADFWRTRYPEIYEDCRRPRYTRRFSVRYLREHFEKVFNKCRRKQQIWVFDIKYLRKNYPEEYNNAFNEVEYRIKVL